jgi:hypothetical protein
MGGFTLLLVVIRALGLRNISPFFNLAMIQGMLERGGHQQLLPFRPNTAVLGATAATQACRRNSFNEYGDATVFQ